MSVQYTQEQQTAIYTRGGDILVSAAAGSGKTAVLTERIVEYVAGGRADISELLVVTFTEAAAAEMKERVAHRIAQRLEQQPNNIHLARQVALLPSADISTVHAFCRKLLKQHFQQVGLDPSFKVGDDTELSLIKAQVMDELFEEEYERENNRPFLDLADVFGGRVMDVQLDDLIREMHTFIQNEPYPLQAAQAFAQAYRQDFDNLDALAWTDIARQELADGLEAALEGVGLARELCRLPQGPFVYLPVLDKDEALLNRLLDTTDQAFVRIYDAFKAIEWEKLPTIRATDWVDPHLKERAMDIRNTDIKGRVKKLGQGVFFTHPAKMAKDLHALGSRVQALIDITLRFGQKYAEEKRARNIVDFNDLEHFTIRLLTQDAPPALGYKEVLIDEYQDSNAVQELIFSKAAGQNGRFMVGDVKQSIYRFRRANPLLFIQKLQPSSTVKRVDLTQNFRSRAQVLDAVNFFFARLMSAQVGEVEYDAQALLRLGAAYPAGDYQTAVELADTADEDELTTLEQEARVMARCIRERVGRQLVWDGERQASRPCRLSDIVILTRAKNVFGDLTEALKQNGVDAAADLQTGFFDTPEIKTALAFLRVVDNPRQDIQLLTLLYSPVYALTADELLAMRQTLPKGDLYDALLLYDNAKVRTFTAHLEKWRKQAAYMPISRLLGVVYDDTRYPAYAGGMPGGAIRQANLRLLLERAIQYEQTSMTGLFHFVQYIEQLHTAKGADSVSAAQFAGLGERVRIMTIHKAKGLEFPIVLVGLLGKQFNRQDERQNVILHSRHGIGLTCVDMNRRTKSNTLSRYSLSRLARREALSEELRVLYVAMTRAKEQLILTGCVKDFEQKQVKWAAAGRQSTAERPLLPLYYRRECNTYLDWLMPCLYASAEAVPLSLRVTDADDFLSSEAEAPYPTPLPDTADTPAEHVDFNQKAYPHPLHIPSKLSISEIKRLFASDVTPDSTAFHTPPDTLDMPVFMQANAADARQMGTALHTIAEHMDVHVHTDMAQIQSLLATLTEKGLLKAEQAALIDPHTILVFMRSPLADRMRAAKLYREIPFVMDMPDPSNMEISDESDERVLVHGIIDCYFIEEGEIVLVDYKSDAVKGDADAWAARHRVQLDIYKKALEQATGLRVKQVLLYSFSLRRAVEVLI